MGRYLYGDEVDRKLHSELYSLENPEINKVCDVKLHTIYTGRAHPDFKAPMDVEQRVADLVSPGWSHQEIAEYVFVRCRASPSRKFI